MLEETGLGSLLEIEEIASQQRKHAIQAAD